MRVWLHGVTIALVVLAAAACGGAQPEPVAPGEPATAVGPDVGTAASSDTATSAPVPGDLGGRTLHVGTDATYPPFESMTAENTIEGIDPSLMAAICEIANCVAKFQNTAWDGIFGALKAGEFNVLMSAITMSAEREENSGGKFTDPYFETGQVLLVKADSEAITGPESLSAAGMNVGVQTGTTGDTAAEKNGVAEENMVRFETIVLAVEALLNGDVDVVVLDKPTADVYMAQHQDEIVVVGEPFTQEQYGILVPAMDTDVLVALNAAIGQLRAQGAIDTIVAEWYSKSKTDG